MGYCSKIVPNSEGDGWDSELLFVCGIEVDLVELIKAVDCGFGVCWFYLDSLSRSLDLVV